MTTRHGTDTLLGPEDTVLLGGRRPDGRRPHVVAALHELPADEPVLAEAMAAARRLDGELVLLHAVGEWLDADLLVIGGPRADESVTDGPGSAESVRLSRAARHDRQQGGGSGSRRDQRSTARTAAGAPEPPAVRHHLRGTSDGPRRDQRPCPSAPPPTNLDVRERQDD